MGKRIAVVMLTLLAASFSAAQVNLPTPTEWAAPAGAPSAPGDTFGISFPSPGVSVDGSAPVISEWTQTAKPSESFTMSGIRFTSRSGADAGTDTTVWVWADNASGGTLRQVDVWKVTGSVLTATLPSDIPYGMYMVWVENQYGPSAPVCINRPTSLWIGPLGNIAQAGSTKRIFGKNIAHDHGISDAYVYVKPASGGSFTSCTVTAVDPYSVAFTVPGGLSNGDYNVYVHSGHGGQYGWGAPVVMTVASAWARAANQITLTPTGSDDRTAIQNAVNTLTGYTNGGTLVLSSGTFILGSMVDLKQNVRMVGAGMDSTAIELRFTSSGQHSGVRFLGSHVAIEDMTLKVCQSTYMPVYGIFNSEYPATNADFLMKNVRWYGDAQTGCGNIGWRLTRGEVTGCEGYRMVAIVGSDIWIHSNTFHGGPYGGNDVAGSEGAISTQNPKQFVMEYNQCQTDNWPNQNGNRNYTQFVPAIDLQWMIWCKRINSGGIPYGSLVNAYFANNTSSDVAVQDNKGEMFLFHGADGCWYGQVSSCSGTTVTVRTDGLIDGYTMNIKGHAPGTTVPSTCAYGNLDGEAYCVIAGGTGVGQARRIVSHTTDSVTVDNAWRINPDSTSKVVLQYIYKDTVCYNNELNAFPSGYVQSYSASQGWDIDANGFGNVADSNLSRRTWQARFIGGSGVSQSYWNEMREEEAYATCFRGMLHTVWTYNGTYPQTIDAVGPVLLGNMVRGGTIETVGSWTAGYMNGLIGSYIATVQAYTTCSQTLAVGNVFEGMTVYGAKRGLLEDDNCETLFRNNSVSVSNVTVYNNDPPVPQPVYLRRYASPLLSGNTYSGGAQNYYKDANNTIAQKPVPLLRVVRFQGTRWTSFSPVSVPLANAGISSMSYSVGSDSGWISAAAGSAVSTESAGTVSVNVDPSGLSVGRHWGSVTVTTGSSGNITAKLGVVVDVVTPDAPPSSGMKLWLKADAGVTKDGSNVVSTWADQSGLGNDVSQTTASNCPLWVDSTLNSKPVIRFVGDGTSSSDALSRTSISFSGASGITMVVVGKLNAGAISFSTFVSYGYDTDAYYIRKYSANNYWQGVGNVLGSCNITNAFRILEADLVDSTDVVTLYEAGTSVATGSKTGSLLSSGFLNIGAVKYWWGGYNWGNSALTGDIAEILIYDHALTTSDRGTMVDYLKAKYGL